MAVALPYGETPWVRITATGTENGSSGVQFGITDLAITQFDASGYAHPVNLPAHRCGPRSPAGRTGGDVGSGFGHAGPGRCVSARDGVHCASPLSLAPEELVNMSRTTVPQPISVRPTVWVRPRQVPPWPT